MPPFPRHRPRPNVAPDLISGVPETGSATLSRHMVAPHSTSALRMARRVIAALLIVAGTLSAGYLGISSYVAEQLVYRTPTPIHRTPSCLRRRFKHITFPSRRSHLAIRRW